MATIAEKSYKHALSRYMNTDNLYGYDTRKGYSVGDDFDFIAGTAKRRRRHPFAAVRIDDGRLRKVRQDDKGFADP